jgi:predicted alpha/beta superfamily hydrolase
VLTRLNDYLVIPSLWWNDPEIAAEYDAAVQDKSKKMEMGEVDSKYWLDVKAKEEQQLK